MYDKEKAVEILAEFRSVVEDHIGTTLDSYSSFKSWASFIAECQQRASQMTGRPIEELDHLRFTYGVGDPNTPEAKVLAQATYSDMKARNAEGGRNHIFAGRMCLASVYGHWEDCFRPAVAKALGVEKNDVKGEVFRDLNKLRQSVVHNQGRATSDVDKNTILDWFSAGDEIVVTSEHLVQLRAAIAEALAALAEAQGLPLG